VTAASVDDRFGLDACAPQKPRAVFIAPPDFGDAGAIGRNRTVRVFHPLDNDASRRGEIVLDRDFENVIRSAEHQPALIQPVGDAFDPGVASIDHIPADGPAREAGGKHRRIGVRPAAAFARRLAERRHLRDHRLFIGVPLGVGGAGE